MIIYREEVRKDFFFFHANFAYCIMDRKGKFFYEDQKKVTS